MSGVMVIVKNTMRILLRNKGFLFFLIVLPILSILLLDIQDYADAEIFSDENQVYEMHEMSERIAYDAKYTQLPVKVYDSTGDGLGMEVTKEIADAGLFQVFYCDTSDQTADAIQKDIKRCRENDRVGGIVVLTKDLEKELKAGTLNTSVTYYDSENDERTELLNTTLSQILGGYMDLAKGLRTQENLIDVIKEYSLMQPQSTQVLVENQSEAELSFTQTNQVRRIGYTFAIATISFLFSGVMIADTVIKERQYKVFNRVKLTDLTAVQYIIAKYMVALLSVVIQTIVIAAALKFLVSQEYAITKPQLLISIAAIGVVFNTLSLCIGILSNDVMNTNYMAFTIWSVSCMLSGCYFDLSDAGKTISRLSNLMPQKWALSCVRMLILHQSGAYNVLFIATIAFLIIIGTFGVIGTTRSIQN